jgi:tRNA(Ile)-lysidine synthase
VSGAVAVAASGGRDSTALLHAVLAPAAKMSLEVHALHVNHGLHAKADAWGEHLERQCERWAAAGAPLTFHQHRVSATPAAGESVEAWARRVRYQALGAMARQHGISLVLLAHHRRDQAETFLLQALRGAGPAGLAAMPREIEREGITWARPWIDMPRSAIESYVRRHRLRFVDDPSNADFRFARSRMRVAVWPALEAAFPEAEAALGAAARRAHQARVALDETARLDLARIAEGDTLLLDGWEALSPARRALALSAWLRRQGQAASQALIDRLLRELPGKSPARWPLGARGELRRFRGCLRIDSARHEASPVRAQALHVPGPGAYPAPSWRGTLVVRPVEEGGVALDRLLHCELRPRTGSEQFQAAPNRPPRSLKKQFQAAAVSPWQRDVPLLYCDGKLLFVPGLGIDARACAVKGEQQAQLEWMPDADGWLLHCNM